MYNLYEQEALNTPVECFYFDAEKANFPVRPHWHYFAEAIYMLSGVMEVNDGENTYIVREGDMVFFHPRTVHSFYPAGEKKITIDRDPEASKNIVFAGLKFDINKMNTSPDYAPKLRNIFRKAKDNGMPTFFNAEKTREMYCRYLFLDCADEMKTQRYGFDMLVRTRISNLLLNIVRKWMDEDNFVIESNLYDEEQTYDIDAITGFIDEHLKDNLQVADIAAQCGLSYSCFAKKFRALYRISCKEYIETMRIFKVEEYLLFTDFDLNYISQETGFSDCSHMIKSFRKYRNCTPKQFRMKKRN